MKRSCILPLAILFLQCQNAEPPALINKFDDSRLRQLYDLQDQRQAPGLIPFLNHQDNILRESAALAFASLQDPMAKGPLGLLLRDPVAGVRKAAAYALGQLSDTTLQQLLMQSVQEENDPEVVSTLLEALGKCSTQQTGLSFLIETDGLPPHAQAWGIYRAGLNGVYSTSGLSQVIGLLGSNQSTARLGAAHFLARIPGLDLSPYLSDLTASCAMDSIPEIRMALALAMGKAGVDATDPLTDLLRNDKDYRVRINAIRGLSNLPIDPLEVLPALQDENVHVAVTAANFLKDSRSPALADTLKSLAREAANVQVSATLYAAGLASPGLHTDLRNYLRERFSKTDNPYHQAHYLEALSQQIDEQEFLRSVLFGDYAAVVTTTAINGLYRINRNEKFPEELKDDFAAIYKQAIASGDVAITGIAAQALRDESTQFKNFFSDLGFLDSALMKLTLPRDIETYQELHRTRNYLLDLEESSTAEVSYNNPIDWDLVTNIPSDQKIRISTTKGDVMMQLLVDESPATVAFIWKLMESGFYHGKTFHRVVPNFVAQGGCPRGDGWGSTEQTIRSEFGTRKYQTGSVGMASAGKDTESCQWFITHSPTPHLDGRYTIFAQVVSGMEVVHRLEIGDQILEIEKY